MKNKIHYLERNRTAELYAFYQAAYFSHGWLWGAPEGLSDQPEAFRLFLEQTQGIRYIEASRIIRVDEISEEAAAKLAGFLRYPPIVLRKED